MWLNFWRNERVDFADFDLYDFEQFQDVMTNTEVTTVVNSALVTFTISTEFIGVLADSVYDYCFGKQINLRNTARWKHNFSGEVRAFLLERARYLQAYDRDINKGISDGDSTKVVTDGESVSGSANTQKTGNVRNGQISNVEGSDTQRGEKSLNSSLTTLRNQSTSTNYLGTQNEEAGESGSILQEGVHRLAKSNENEIDLGMQNGASLSKDVDRRITENTGKNSGLTIAEKESNFKFQEWFEDLYAILDSYFTMGGNQYA